MTERRRGLGRGLGALIPHGSGTATQRPVDVFFPESEKYAAKPVNQDAEPVDQDQPEPSAQGEQRASASEQMFADLERPRQESETSPVVEVANDTPAGTDSDLIAVPGARFAEVPVAAIHPNANQPRTIFDDDELNELASSIREVGVLQPVVVRPSGTGADGENTYELIMGERRWRASRLVGNTTVPAIIRETAEDAMLRDALLENLHRVQLNPLEEAAAYQQLLDDFNCTHDELASRIARSRPQISNTLRLLKLPPLVQRRVAAGILSAGHARALLGLADGAAMERLAQRIVAEGLSVRATEEIITLGEDPEQPELRRRPRPGGHSAALGELATRLSDKFDTKVKVNLGQRKGHVTIEFASVDDLNRILGVLDPDDPGVFRAESPLGS